MLPNRQALADSKCWGTGWVLYRSESVDGGFEEPYTVSGVSVPNSGVLPTTLALHDLQKPTLESLCRVDQHAGGSRSPSSGAESLPTCARKVSSVVVGGHQADCYKLLSILYTCERP